MSILERMAITVCEAERHDMFAEGDEWDNWGAEVSYLTCFTCGVTWNLHNGQWRIIDYGATYDSW